MSAPIKGALKSTVRTFALPVLLGIASLLASSVAVAGVTNQVTIKTYEDFNAGEADTTVITSIGEVKPGWLTQKQELDFESGVWSALTLEGGTVLMGTAQDGALFISRKGGSATKLTTIPNVIGVVSMVRGDDRKIYVGTMPEGQIWRVDPVTAKTTKVATLADAETVWALGSTNGKLYAGVGPKGNLFEVNPKTGASKIIFASEDKRILSITTTRDGAVWFGTSEKALLYRYDPKRNVTRAMADFKGNEVTALTPYRGGVVAAANELAELSKSGSKSKRAIDKALGNNQTGQAATTKRVGSEPGADKLTPTTTIAPRKGGRKGTGALFYVRGDGSLEELHRLSQTYYTSLALTADGDILAGAADKGRVYMIDKDHSVSTLFDVEQRVVSHVMYRKSSGITFTTDDANMLFRTQGQARKAHYISKVFDLKAPSRFGRVSWRGSRKLTVETRSGNTSEPGKGWSEWIRASNVSRGGGGMSGGKAASPVGRYAQIRFQFSGAPDETLRAATLYYLPQNQPTKLRAITVAAKENRGAMATNKSGALKPRSPIIKVSWTTDNPDKDATVYTLEVRREGEARWRKLTTGNTPLTKTSYEWNTETFPNGYYRLRVTASDRSSNAQPRARTTTKTTELFAVDNARPIIDGLVVRYPSASARVRDAMSPIAEMSFSIDDGPWIIGTTRDGLFDDLAEMLVMPLDKNLRPGLHTLAVRVADEAGNIGSESISFRVAP